MAVVPARLAPVPAEVALRRVQQVETIRLEAKEVRRIAAFLDTPGIPQRMAERAADAATLLEALARDMERFWALKGAPILTTNPPPEAA